MLELLDADMSMRKILRQKAEAEAERERKKAQARKERGR